MKVKPNLEKCIICGHNFVVAERRTDGPVCLSCKMYEANKKKEQPKK